MAKKVETLPTAAEEKTTKKPGVEVEHTPGMKQIGALFLGTVGGLVTGAAVKGVTAIKDRAAQYAALEHQNNNQTSDEIAIAKAAEVARAEHLPYEDAFGRLKQESLTATQEVAQRRAANNAAASDHAEIITNTALGAGTGASSGLALASVALAGLRILRKRRGLFHKGFDTWVSFNEPSRIKYISINDKGNEIDIAVRNQWDRYGLESDLTELLSKNGKRHDFRVESEDDLYGKQLPNTITVKLWGWDKDKKCWVENTTQPRDVIAALLDARYITKEQAAVITPECDAIVRESIKPFRPELFSRC